ncbi:hypothetical protein BC830DRAFT_245170 [Chytriomyces sp. MP71]|nr:hypothetical protein BC830DRAFT_245170 [Chytriomyces sp. MP71]
MWSLRQLKPSIPLVPQVGKSQRELMMDEMRWMSEDFREERKWKMGMASLCARWVVEWHSVTDKSLLCIKARPLNFINLSTEYYASMAQPGLVPAITVQDVTMEEATAPCTISPTGSVSKVEIAAKGEGLAQIVNMYDSETENDEAGAPSTAAVPPPAFSSEATTNPSAMVVDPPTTVIYSSAPTIAAVTKAPQLTVLPTNEGPQIIPVTTSTAHAPIIFDMSKLTYTYSTPAKTPHHISNSIFAPPNLSDIYPPTPNSMVAAEDIQPFAPSLFHSQLVAKDYTRWDEHGRLKGYGYLESEEEDGAIVDREADISSKDSRKFVQLGRSSVLNVSS